MKHQYQSQMNKSTREYDERMLTLMRQLPPCGLKESEDHKVIDSLHMLQSILLERIIEKGFVFQISEEQVLERLKIQQEELERYSNLHQEHNAALNEIEQLKQQLLTISSAAK